MNRQPPPLDLPLVREFFPELAPSVVEQLGALGASVQDWNTRLNLISRKDAAHIEEHHILHALTLTKLLRPADGARFVDLGTGGGFPGLVLAICYPQCRFTLVDSITKKITAVQEIARELGLQNVRGKARRAETLREKCDYVTGRAVTALPKFLSWAAPLLRQTASASEKPEPSATAPASKLREAPAGELAIPSKGGPISEGVTGGVLYFKGTLWREELADHPWQPSSVWPLDAWLPRPFFAEKFLLHFAPPAPTCSP